MTPSELLKATKLETKTNVSGVYLIYCIPSGKGYIGRSTYIRRRLSVHRRELKLGTHKNSHLQRSWNKYGSSCFSFHVLEVLSKEYLNERELFFIRQLDPSLCFNMISCQIVPDGSWRAELMKEKWRTNPGQFFKRGTEEISEIKRALNEGKTTKEISTQFKIGKALLADIRGGRTWAKVDPQLIRPKRIKKTISKEIKLAMREDLRRNLNREDFIEKYQVGIHTYYAYRKDIVALNALSAATSAGISNLE